MKHVPYTLIPAALLAATTTLPALAYRLATPHAAPAGLRTGADPLPPTASSCDAEDASEPTYLPALAAGTVPGREHGR